MGQLPLVIHKSWHPYLSYQFELGDLNFLNHVVLSKCTYYPEAKNIFRVFSMPLGDIKVVILGQDPYPQPNQAIGYAFAVSENTSTPKSLSIIYKEVMDTCWELGHSPDNYPASMLEWKTLEHWREQGVFLLNTALTVEHGKPGSHTVYWGNFTKFVIGVISKEVNPVWLLWGLHAQKYESMIRALQPNNYGNILKAPHPAAEIYSNGKAGFYGSNHFQKANQLLTLKIKW